MTKLTGVVAIRPIVWDDYFCPTALCLLAKAIKGQFFRFPADCSDRWAVSCHIPRNLTRWYSRSLFLQDLNLTRKFPRPLSQDFPLNEAVDKISEQLGYKGLIARSGKRAIEAYISRKTGSYSLKTIPPEGEGLYHALWKLTTYWRNPLRHMLCSLGLGRWWKNI